MSDPRTRRSMFGIPVLDWTRGRTKGRKGSTLLLWPDLWDTFAFGLIDQVRVMRRLWESNPEQMVMHLPMMPTLMANAWIEIKESFGHYSWLKRMQASPRRIGVMARIRTQADVRALRTLQEEGFPAAAWGAILFPSEPLQLAILPRLDYCQVGAPGSEFLRSQPLKVEWLRSIQAQCGALGIPFHFKSWNGWVPIEDAPEDLVADGRLPRRDGYLRIGTRSVAAYMDGIAFKAGFPW